MSTGLFRDRDHVHVSYEGHEIFPMARHIYELNGYLPHFDQLPTQEEYRVKNG